jgi:hypothetical protein
MRVAKYIKAMIWRYRWWGISVIGLACLIIPWSHVQRRWEIYTSMGTIGAVVIAIFLDQLKTFFHSPNMEIQISDELIDRRPGFLWVRGRVVNNGDATARRCVIKVLGVTGYSDQYEHDLEGGFLNWRGGDGGPVDIYPEDSFIFDFGLRQEQTSPPCLELSGQVSGNQLAVLITAPGESKVSIRLYGDNFKFVSKTALINVGKAFDDVKISTDLGTR